MAGAKCVRTLDWFTHSLRASSPLGSRARLSGARFGVGVREGEALLLSPPAPNLSQLASQSARDPPLAPENLAGDPNGEFARRLVYHLTGT